MKLNEVQMLEVKQMFFDFVEGREQIFNYENGYITMKLAKILLRRRGIYMTGDQIKDMINEWHANYEILVYSDKENLYKSSEVGFCFVVNREYFDMERARIGARLLAFEVKQHYADAPTSKRKM